MELSVIMTFRNDEKTISASIESILEQNLKKWELILIDRNSDDKSESIAQQYASADKRIVYLRTEKKSIADALNEGIKVSAGKYIGIIEPGDLAHPQKLEKQYRFLNENETIDVVATCAEYISDEGLRFENFEYIKWTNSILAHEEIEYSSFITCPLIYSTIVFRKQIAQNVLYRTGAFPEDYELILRLLNKGTAMHKLSEHLIEWKDYPGRLERNSDLSSSPTFRELKAYYISEWLKKHNPYHPRIISWGAGKVARQCFSLLKELGIQPKFQVDLHANPQYNVIEYTQTPPAGSNFIVAYASNHEIRTLIREFLSTIGYLEGKDYIFCS